MAVFLKRSSSGKHKKPRIRLVNKRSLVILTLTSLWALWLVSPSQNMLIKLIARSSSPDVSLAFLREINVREPDNREVIKLLIETYSQLGQLDEALALSETIISKEDASRDWDAFGVYLQLLMDISRRAEPRSDVDAKLRRIINTTDYVPEAELARKLADAAIELSMPEKGYAILLPHLQSGETNHQELVGLALQNSDYDNSLKIQLDAFQEFENQEQAQSLLALFVSSNSPLLSKQFIDSYTGKLSQQPDFLQLTVSHSILMGNTDTALTQSKKLLAIEPSDELTASTAELAIATNNQPLAISLLLQLVNNTNAPEHIAKLHDLYRWQGNIPKAFTLSKTLLEQSPSETQLRAGIEESRALGDIYHESIFYQRLAASNQIKPSEYSSWLNALEKAEGTSAALASIKRLAVKRPHDSTLVSHKVRLYDYQSDYLRVIEQWNHLRRLRSPTTTEALCFSNAYIMTHQPKYALAALTTPKDWLDAGEDYLETVASLAWETSNRKVAQLSQDRLIALSSDSVDVYRYLKTSSPILNEKIDELVILYRNTNNEQPLLAAIKAAKDANDQKQFNRLLKLATSSPSLTNNTSIQLFQAQLAIDNQDPEKARTLYNKILDKEPSNTSAISGLIWLAINSQDQDVLATLYNRYKLAFKGDEELWLSFATSAQILGYIKESELWYQQLLLNTEKPDVAVLINFAAMLELQGRYDTAFKLRHFVASQLSEELLRLEDGDITYRSLIALFMGEKFAHAQVAEAALLHPNNRKTEELFQYFLTQNQADNLLFWHQRTALKHYLLPDWQQLSIAIQRKDHKEIERLLAESVNLPVADRNTALQLTGQYQKAWQQGQENVGRMVDLQAEKQLRRVHVNQHPDKTHSLRSQVAQNSQWDITKFSLDYYAPHRDGHWRLGSDYQIADAPLQLQGNDIDSESRLRGQYLLRQLDTSWKVNVDIADGLGDQRLGASISYQAPIDSYWTASLKLGLNNAVEASQLLTLAGQDNIAGLTLNYQPTSRESVAIQFNLHDLSTRFDDEIGQGWDLNLRVSEQLFFADPAWQLYGDVSMQRVNLSDKPLDGINAWRNGTFPLTSGDFVEDEYQRVAIGQRVWHGNPGVPGAMVPSPRYWFDSSLGYNVTNSRFDMTLSSGLGWRVVGNDELYLSVDWQSQDRNGDESMKLSLGYFYSF